MAEEFKQKSALLKGKWDELLKQSSALNNELKYYRVAAKLLRWQAEGGDVPQQLVECVQRIRVVETVKEKKNIELQ